MLGQGSDSKSSLPCRICLKIPASVSEQRKAYTTTENIRLKRCSIFYGMNGKKLTSPKWGNTTKQNVQNHPSAPDISFWTIAFLKHLWCYIIGAPNNIREFITCGNGNKWFI
jgi:hypothetical protein